MQLPLSLRHRKFAIYWPGLILGWVGNQVLIWAIPWHIRDFTNNPLALGVIGLIRLAPTVLFSLFAGAIADSFNRRRVVFITQGMMGSVGLALAALTWSDKIQLWHIYLLLGLHASAYIFSMPARYSLTPNLVPGSALTNALSVEFFGIQIASLGGPVLSGWLLNRFGQSAAYLAAAVLFGAILTSLLLMGPIPQAKRETARKGIDWESIKEGIQFTFRHPLILPSMLLDFLATLLTRADSLMPFFARDILGLNAAQYGWLSAASALGATASGFALSQVREIRHQGKLLLAAVGTIGVSAIMFGFSRSFPLSMGALIVIGSSDSISSIIRSTIRQTHTSDNLRGRMTSVNQIFFMGGPYLGDVKSGFLGGVIGVPLAVALGGMACVFSVGWIGFQWPKLRGYDGATR